MIIEERMFSKIVIKKPIRKSLVEQVATQIEQLIEKEHWQVGEKIPPEMELMERFSVSRNTLREAIRALVHLGFLETRQGSGTIVRSKSSLGVAIQRHIKKSNLIETLEVRLALEREAAYLAATRRSNYDLKEMDKYIKQCEMYVEKDEAKFIESDIKFHKSIVNASHNQVLIDLYEHMTETLYYSIKTLLKMRKKLNKEGQIHRNLYVAIRDKKIDQAIQSVNTYIDELKEMLNNVEEDRIWET